jgi:hypothetical protein
MKVQKMKKPGDVLNVPCDWCDDSSAYSMERKPGYPVYLYACPKHKAKMESVIEQVKRYKIGS